MTNRQRLSTGVDGLDEILDGGLLAERAYMLRGTPGTGKTILGLQFLTAEADGTSLCINFEESTANVRENAASLGIDVSDVEFLDLSPEADVFLEDQRYDVFAPDEVESETVVSEIVDAVEEHEPDRVFVDPVTQLRYFTPDEYQFRKQVASFIRHLTNRGATVIFSTQPTSDSSDEDLQFICDGTIELDRVEKGRVIEVTKFRGSDFQSGQHTLRIEHGGHQVFPKLQPGHHGQGFIDGTVSSGVDKLDEMLHGGLERGTVTVLSGPSGVGKTTTGTHFMREAATRDERSVAYLFEEAESTFAHRSEAIGIPIGEMREKGTLSIEEMEPISISSDEFAAMVREEVEQNDAKVVMIDGISGYRLSIRGEQESLVREIHSLCRYLKNMGVTVILVDDVASITGDFQVTSDRISYLADNILFLRYLEHQGQLQKAAGVLKKRASDFERTLRLFQITETGIELGEPLTNLRGILTGAPEWTDRADEHLE